MPFLQGRTDRTSRTLTVESCLASPRTVGSSVFFSPMEASECGLRFVTLQTIRNTLLCINVHRIICNYMNINITFTDMDGHPSYLVELLTCKSSGSMQLWHDLQLHQCFQSEGYSLLSYAMMASDEKKFTSFKRAIRKSIKSCKSTGYWDWSMRLECFKRFQSDETYMKYYC